MGSQNRDEHAPSREVDVDEPQVAFLGGRPALRAEPPVSLVGRALGGGKFLIQSLLKAGAMGAIYRAHHVPLDKSVCVKVMHRELATDERFVRRFHREAKAASRLDHPSSVHVLDFGREPDGTLFIVMELLNGTDLFEVIQREAPLEPRRVADITCQLLSVLGAAHDAGILHRDLKPENIMLVPAGDDDERGEVVKVCDFGIAKLNAEADDEACPGDDAAPPSRRASADGAKRKLTTRGLLIGTPEYMSPEQARGEAADPRSDLYSVGVILYQMLTRRLPFEGDTSLGIVLRQIHDLPEAPSTLDPNVPPALERICMRALEKDLADRWLNARAMRSAIRSIMDVSASATSSDDSVDVEVELEPEPEPDDDWSERASRPSLLATIMEPQRSGRRAGYVVSTILGAVLAMAALVGVRGRLATADASEHQEPARAGAPAVSVVSAPHVDAPMSSKEQTVAPTPSAAASAVVRSVRAQAPRKATSRPAPSATPTTEAPPSLPPPSASDDGDFTTAN